MLGEDAAQPSAGPSRPRRKAEAENWDEDFDFEPKIAPTPTATAKPRRVSSRLSSRGGDDLANQPAPRRVSLAHDKGKARDSAATAAAAAATAEHEVEEDWDAWDNSPPRITPSRLSHRRQSRGPPPLTIEPFSPPRVSSSSSSTSPLPSPSAIGTDTPRATGMSTAPLLGSHHPQPSRSAALGKLVKRQPSHSFVPMASTNDSSSSLGSWNHLHNRSSPNLSAAEPRVKRELRHMKSGEMMPPPPVPSSATAGLNRRRSRRDNAQESLGQGAKTVQDSRLPMSPSRDQLSGLQQREKPGFWRRLSGAHGMQIDVDNDNRRRRSSSVGSPNKSRPKPLPTEHPPLPPLPANIRSPSSASNTSNHSGSSSVSMSRSNLGITSMIRRSTSNLANKVKGRSGNSTEPPSPRYKGVRSSSNASAASDGSEMPNRQRMSRSGSQQSHSGGYHLPTPSPQSPYNDQLSPFSPMGAPGPHSMQSSIAGSSNGHDYGIGGGARREYSGEISSGEEEAGGGEDDDAQITPKRKKRPASTAPPRSQGWGGEAWSGFPPPLPHPTSFSRSPVKSSAPPLEPPTPPEEASKSFATLKRLSSLSKKHGRKLSGGWKFGTGSSTSSEEKKSVRKLETVMGSPSKTGRLQTDVERLNQENDSRREQGDDLFDENEIDKSRGIRGGSVSVPSSMFKSAASRNLADAFDRREPMPEMSKSSIAQDGGSVRKKGDKDRRRQSWNDFVIPRNVLEKQRELKEGIRGVRKFATGVEALRTLLSTHAAVSSRIGSADPSTKQTFDQLEREFDQWWEMATVLIEVGSTGQGMSGSAASTSLGLQTPPSPDSPKRTRRITLASEEAKAASEMMRRARTDLPPGLPSSQSGIPLGQTSPLDKAESRKTSLPDPARVDLHGDPANLLIGGPPRASPDHWRASTLRQELSKRQLEVLRTMLRTPVSDQSVPSSTGSYRPPLIRGLSGLSTISAVSSGMANSAAHKHGARPSISRSGSAFTRSPQIQQSPLQSQSPSQGNPNSFPSPSDSSYTYIKASDSMPSPITASVLAAGDIRRYPAPPHGVASSPAQQKVMSAQAAKMRRGSKVGLAGLKEFLRGLKGKESRRDLNVLASDSPTATPAENNTSGVDRSNDHRTPRTGNGRVRISVQRTTSQAVELSPSPVPAHELGRRPSEISVGGRGGFTAGSPTPTSARWARSGSSAIAPLQVDSSIPSTPSHPSLFVAEHGSKGPEEDAALPKTTQSMIASKVPSPIPVKSPIRATKQDAGPPVSGKERRRPGLRGIFRGGSGNWGDLVNGGPKSPTTPGPVSAGMTTSASMSSFSSAPPLSQASRTDRAQSTAAAYGRMGHQVSTATHNLPHPNPRQTSDPVRRDARLVSDTPSYRSTPAHVGLGVGGVPAQMTQNEFGQSTVRSTAARQSSSSEDQEQGIGDEVEVEGDMTVRPRKSRILGLGWPEEAPRAQAAGLGAGAGSARIESGASVATAFTADSGWSRVSHSGWTGVGPLRPYDSETDGDGEGNGEGEGETGYEDGAGAFSQRGVAGGADWTDAASAAGADARQSGESVNTMAAAGIIALTPENLPVLLEYLRQCEGKLGEWRRRVDVLNLGNDEL